MIVRNITFEASTTASRAWTPRRNTDGAWAGTGEWDTDTTRDLPARERAYGSTTTNPDVATADGALQTYFSNKYQVHDGRLDIADASDLVTVSYRDRFRDRHDETMLIG